MSHDSPVPVGKHNSVKTLLHRLGPLVGSKGIYLNFPIAKSVDMKQIKSDPLVGPRGLG